MLTVVLPMNTSARFLGGVWKGPPCGTWAGELVAVLPWVAAGLPSMLTSALRAPSSCPTKGWGSGVGTGPPGVGIITMWMSVPTTWSPCFAAGLAMRVLHLAQLVQVDDAA